MFVKMVNGSELSNAHIHQVTKLLLTTGYFDIASQNNQLGLDVIEFQKLVTVIPAQKFLRVMLDQQNNVAGFYLALTQTETKELFANMPNHYEKTPDNSYFAENLYRLYVEETTAFDLIVHYRAIQRHLQGNGLFKLLTQDLIALAKAKKCTRLFSAIWSTKHKSLEIFKYYGAQERGILDFSHIHFNDYLINLVSSVEDVGNRLQNPEKSHVDKLIPLTAQMYLAAANKLRLPCQYNTNFAGIEVKICKNRYLFRQGSTPFNDDTSASIAYNKYCINAILREAGFPVPLSHTVSKNDYINGKWQLPPLQYPLVAKPTVNSLHGIDVLCNITNQQDLLAYLNTKIHKHRFITIEQYQANLTVYRVTVFYNKVIAVARRNPAAVVGNGLNSISELVSIENQRRQQFIGTYTVDLIKLGQEHHAKLNGLGITVDYIPNPGEKIILCYASSSRHGESLDSLGQSICHENAKLFCKAAKVLNLNLVGFDVICEDINRPVQNSRGFIIEANSNPDLTIHEAPTSGIPVPVIKILLKRIIYKHPVGYFFTVSKSIYKSHVFLIRSGILVITVLLMSTLIGK